MEAFNSLSDYEAWIRGDSMFDLFYNFISVTYEQERFTHNAALNRS